MRRSVLRGLAFAAVSAAAVFCEERASACGGTFCDSPPPGKPPMPVDQSGENIVFVLTQGHVEAHVQIQYTGDPSRFAWLVPVPKVPEVTVGSQRFVTALLNATVPTFTLRSTLDLCGGGQITSPGCGLSSARNDSSAFDGVGADASTRRSSPDLVAAHEAVGAFDVTILTPKSADEVTTWLDENSFLQTPDAPPILQDYVDSGHVFVAVKLLPGAGVNEIHPLVLSYDGDAPCIPLKLTAVAATDDMNVRAFFLGERRVVPTTYHEVTLNPVRLDWLGLGANYDSVVSSAVDEPGGDGHAFVTEFAGASSVVDATQIYDPSWNAGAYRIARPDEVMSLLESQGLVTCTAAGCVAVEPLVLPIVRKYLPAPPGVAEQSFYSCVSCYSARIDRTVWDGDAFADELEDRVIAPARHASEVVGATPYLTRLFTRISPGEMTADPEFVVLPRSAGDVPSAFVATEHASCGGDLALKVPARPALALEGGAIPRFARSTPAALVVAEYDPSGTRTVLFDNGDAVDGKISAWNRSQGYPHPIPEGRGSGCGVSGVATGPTGIVGAAALLSLLRRLGRRRLRPSPAAAAGPTRR
jgi:hypothetical protein